MLFRSFGIHKVKLNDPTSLSGTIGYIALALLIIFCIAILMCLKVCCPAVLTSCCSGILTGIKLLLCGIWDLLQSCVDRLRNKNTGASPRRNRNNYRTRRENRSILKNNRDNLFDSDMESAYSLSPTVRFKNSLPSAPQDHYHTVDIQTPQSQPEYNTTNDETNIPESNNSSPALPGKRFGNIIKTPSMQMLENKYEWHMIRSTFRLQLCKKSGSKNIFWNYYLNTCTDDHDQPVLNQPPSPKLIKNYLKEVNKLQPPPLMYNEGKRILVSNHNIIFDPVKKQFINIITKSPQPGYKIPVEE